MATLPAISTPSAQPALLAISGGRDSVALLHLLVTTGRDRLILCHLNHSLRGRESGQDAAFVRRLAIAHDLPCEIEKINLPALAAQHGMSIETAAREARHHFLARMAVKHHASDVFMAHHADDQAETILANLCRGAGLQGLAGMRDQQWIGTHFKIIRPLLHWRRAEIDDYIKAHHLRFREDSSNTSPEHRRNRLRHELLPLLKDIFQRDVSPIIARLGAHAATDSDCLRQQAVEFFTANHLLQPDHSLRITRALCSLHPALLSRVLSHWLRASLGLPSIESAEIESALTMLRPGGPAKINLPGGYHLRRKARHLRVEAPANSVAASA